MMLECLNAVLWIKGLYFLSIEVGTAAKLEIDADCRCFINQDKSFLIT